VARSRYARWTLQAFALIPAGLVALVACGGSPYGDFSSVPDREACELNVSLPNMACSEACPVKVRGALANVAGVQRVDVDYDSRSAVVGAVYPACSEAGFEDMMRQLYMQGYKARVVSARSLTPWER
jgi:copper chaperone CopZ